MVSTQLESPPLVEDKIAGSDPRSDLTAWPPLPTPAEWKPAIARHQAHSNWRATYQLANTLLPLAGVWYLISLIVPVSAWLAVPLAVLAGLLMVRTFIIFHDCGHGSFFSTRWANDLAGALTGLITFTPYVHWRWQHAVHHATSGDLERRGVGDIWTMTVREYLEAPKSERLAYRVMRNPVVLFAIAPAFIFVVWHRIPSPTAGRRERASVWTMNLAVAAMVTGMGFWIGFAPYILLQLVAIAVASASGVWLFYVQHQYKDTYWEDSSNWDYTAAALRGSSFYDLPPVLRWFSGNIGYHHIHHLSPRVPNYNLVRCHRTESIFQVVEPLTLRRSAASLRLHLWSEDAGEMVGFRNLKRMAAGKNGG